MESAYEERVVKFLDEYEWYAGALRAAREREGGESDMPVQQTLCRGGE